MIKHFLLAISLQLTPLVYHPAHSPGPDLHHHAELDGETWRD
jgi:hypothetical protein